MGSDTVTQTAESRGTSSPTQAHFEQVHETAQERVGALLSGMFDSAQDALFELAERSDDAEEHRACFDLARDLHQTKDAFRARFLQAFGRAKRIWAARLFEVKSTDQDLWRAQALSDKTSAHFSVLLAEISKRVSELLECDVPAPDALPISPVWVVRCYFEALAEFTEDKKTRQFLNTLFVRFVVDRLGPVYGEVYTQLGEPSH